MGWDPEQNGSGEIDRVLVFVGSLPWIGNCQVNGFVYIMYSCIGKEGRLKGVRWGVWIPDMYCAALFTTEQYSEGGASWG